MCSLLLIPAPGPWCRLLLFLQRQFQGFPEKPHSERCTALLRHGLLDPGSLEVSSWATRGAMGSFLPSCPHRLLLCKEVAAQHQHWRMAVCTVD